MVFTMLYVFRVDTGDMIQMDMNLAVATVAELKVCIQRACRVAPDKQVLLASGGECMEAHARVCSYCAGTESNPIFLFSKSSLEDRSLSPENDLYDMGMTEQVEQSLELQPTYSTLVARAALAQSLCELGKELARDCERIIHHQHLQQQGWSAAIANLEDMAGFFEDRSNSFVKDFQAHIDTREENLATLKNFQNELLTLARIPILPPLLANAVSLSGLDMETKITTMTLLEWISAKDNQSSLQAVAEQCTGFLQQTDASVLEALKENVDKALTCARKSDMKEIGGLSERLCGLESLMVRAKNYVKEQSELAQGFQQNQYRASNLGDASILPDLCASHKKQLLVMSEIHSKLKDIRLRCVKAREELSQNLILRMRWVAFAQNEMQNVGNNLMIYQESLKRGRRHLLIIRQVQRAPEMYCLAVAEVVRRKKFSSAFLQWANDLSNRLLATYNEESERRREFKVQFGGHFLEALFPGLDNEPSPYATQAPEPFDLYLPDISEEHMEILRSTLPELALNVSWTELSAVAQMFLSRAQTDQEDSKSHLPLEARIVASVSQMGLSDKMDDAILRPDDPLRDADADAEFDKVAQSRLEEESVAKEISDSLRERFGQASQIFLSAASSLKEELNGLRSQSIADKDSIFLLIGKIHNHVVQLTEGYIAELVSVQSRLELSEANACSRISDLEKIIGDKDATLKDREEASRSYQLDTEKHIDNLKASHDKDVATLKETFRIRESELLANEERMRNDAERLNQTLEQTKKDLKEEIRIVDELNRNWADKVSQIEEQHALLVKELNETAETEAKRLEEQVNELKQSLVQTELTAEVEMENRVKELESEHARASQEFENQLNSQHKKELEEMKAKHAAEIAELTERLSTEHQAELQEVSQRLMNEYKNELGGLRSRFRLMSLTSMEKSPSDSSLEKIERGDMIELVNHEAIVGQMREDAEVALEKAVAEAVQAEQQRCKAKQEESMAAARARMEEEKQVWLDEAVTRAMADRERQIEDDLRSAKARMEEERQLLLTEAVNVACAEKDRQIEVMMDRYKTLSTECQRHRDTVRRLSDNDTRSGAGTVDPLIERVSNLEKDKKELKEEIKLLRQFAKESKILERRKRVDSDLRISSSSDTDTKGAEGKEDMSQSIAIMTESTYQREVGTSPELGRVARNRTLRRAFYVDNCAYDDPVLIIWNSEYKHYLVLQESTSLFFLHPDSVEALRLRLRKNGLPKKWYALGTVVRKELCSARRADNRYNVPNGTKFYRVIVKPLPSQKGESSETPQPPPPALPALPSASEDCEDGDSS